MESDNIVLEFTDEKLDIDLEPPKELFEAKMIVDVKSVNGECPLWDERRNAFIWLDNFGGKLFILTINDCMLTSVTLPENAGSFALCESGDRLLMASVSYFAFYYFDSHSYKVLKSPYVKIEASQ